MNDLKDKLKKMQMTMTEKDEQHVDIIIDLIKMYSELKEYDRIKTLVEYRLIPLLEQVQKNEIVKILYNADLNLKLKGGK